MQISIDSAIIPKNGTVQALPLRGFIRHHYANLIIYPRIIDADRR
jgi:hypothetical protein